MRFSLFSLPNKILINKSLSDKESRFPNKGLIDTFKGSNLTLSFAQFSVTQHE